MLNSLIIRAFKEADRLHKRQKRKYSGKPYITHIIRLVGAVAIAQDSTTEEVIGTIFHDSVEDCCADSDEQKTMLDYIAKEYGHGVSEIVSGLTNPTKFSTLPRAERKALDRQHIAAQSLKVKRIKAIDRIDNLTETINDIKVGYKNIDPDFVLMYAQESEELLKVLAGIDDYYLKLLENTIEEVRTVAKHYFD